jgi:hypothetical protein
MKLKQLLSSTSVTLIVATVMLCCARQCRAQSDGLPGVDDQVMTARQQYDAALSQLVQIRAQQMQQARASQEYVTAENAVAQTYQVYTQDRERAIADLTANDPDYARLAAQHDAVMSELEAARRDPNTTVERFNELYNRKWAVAKQMEAKRKAVMEKAGGGQDWQQWITASRNLESLQTQLAAQVEASSEVAKARADADAAKANLATLEAQYAVAANNPPQSQSFGNGGTTPEIFSSDDGWDGYDYGNVYGYGGYRRYISGNGRGYGRGSSGAPSGAGRAGGGQGGGARSGGGAAGGHHR